jgi:ketosteroid isomerase-like protein
MSSENVEKLGRIYEQWYERRKLGPDLLAEDVEWVNPADALEPGVRRGRAGFDEAIRSVFDAWGEIRFDMERVMDNGEDVVALGYVRGRGRAAGIELTREHGEIWTFSEGKVSRMRWFHSQSETLRAAGLSE